MNTQQKSTSELGHISTLSSTVCEEANYAFDNNLITHNQYAINVATHAHPSLKFAAISGENRAIAKISAIKKSNEANTAIASNADLATQTKEIPESIEASQKSHASLMSQIVGGES